MHYTYKNSAELGGTSPCDLDPAAVMEDIADLQYAANSYGYALLAAAKGSKEEAYLHDVPYVCAALLIEHLVQVEPTTKADIYIKSDELW